MGVCCVTVVTIIDCKFYLFFLILAFFVIKISLKCMLMLYKCGHLGIQRDGNSEKELDGEIIEMRKKLHNYKETICKLRKENILLKKKVDRKNVKITTICKHLNKRFVKYEADMEQKKNEIDRILKENYGLKQFIATLSHMCGNDLLKQSKFNNPIEEAQREDNTFKRLHIDGHGILCLLLSG